MTMPGFVSRIMADSFLLVWNISAVVTLLVPLFTFVIGRARSDEYDNSNDNGDDNNNNNNNGNNYNNPNCYDNYGYYHGPTHWYQFWKRCNYGDGEEEGEEDNEFQSPWWYIWGGEEDRQREEEGRKPAVTFMYLWILVLFAGLVYMGNTTNMQVSKLEHLRWMLIGFANVCFAILVLLIGLEGIEVEGREMEREGFYGQTAVLLWITAVFGLITSIVFISWTTKRIKKIVRSLQHDETRNNDGSSTAAVGMKSLENGGATGDYVSVEYDQQVTNMKNRESQPAPPGYITN